MLWENFYSGGTGKVDVAGLLISVVAGLSGFTAAFRGSIETPAGMLACSFVCWFVCLLCWFVTGGDTNSSGISIQLH